MGGLIASTLLFLVLLSTSAGAQAPLRIGTILSVTQAPLWAGIDGKFFQKYGIKNTEVIVFSGGQPATAALISGELKINTTGGPAVINARLRGADVVIIARTVGVFPYTLYVSKDIHEPSQLKGKKVGVSRIGGSGYDALIYALKSIKLDPKKDVTILQIGGFADRLAALSSDVIQGTVLNPPFTLRARELGLRPLYDLVASGITYPINQITTTRAFMRDHRDTVKSFLKGLIHGLARFRTDRDFAIQVLSKNLRERDPKILQETYEFWLKVFPKVPSPGPEDATVFLEFMQLKEQRDPKEFVDGSLVQELEREGFVDSLYKGR
ncbi:MAG: ABC transporter substrate-binding protein [Deltaproteobacteria bacterium]|nr:ABC transporter substrate-binding protein [Deltaproteobacteria bacterium]